MGDLLLVHDRQIRFEMQAVYEQGTQVIREILSVFIHTIERLFMTTCTNPLRTSDCENLDRPEGSACVFQNPCHPKVFTHLLHKNHSTEVILTST